MALIGQIAISMVTDTTKFTAGILGASGALKSFQKSATRDIAAGQKAINAGLADVAGGLGALGAAAAGGLRGVATVVRRDAPGVVRQLTDTLDLRAWARASVDALAYTYGGIGRTIGRALAHASGPIAAATKASASSLAYVFKPIGKNLMEMASEYAKAPFLRDAIAQWMAVGQATAYAAKAMVPYLPQLKAVAGGMGRVAVGAALAARGAARLAAAGALQGVSALSSAIGNMVGSLRQAVNELGRFAAVAGGVVAVGLAHVAKGAIALGEQTDQARVVFGDFAKDVIAQSNLMATAFGVSRKLFVSAASTFGSIFEGVGYAQKDVAALSIHFVKLATDLSSLKHIGVDEALEKLHSGLAGQVRPLHNIGIMMSEEAIKSQAARMGIAKLGTELTETQKVQARVAFLTEHLAKATGNLAATAGSAGNEVRSLQGRFENLSDTIGTALLSVAVPAMDELNVALQAVQMAWDASALAAAGASVGVLGATQQQAEGIGFVQRSIGFLTDAWQVMAMGFSAVQSYITAGLAKVASLAQSLAEGIASALRMVGVQVEANNFFKDWSKDLSDLSGKQWEQFQTKLSQPWNSDAMNAFFAQARDKIAAARAELGKPAANVLGLKPKDEGLTKPVKPKELKFAEAAAKGSKEAVNLELRSRYGGGKTADETKKIVGNTATANQHLSKIHDTLREALGGGGTILFDNF